MTRDIPFNEHFGDKKEDIGPKTLNALKNELINPFKVLAALQTHIPERLLESHYAEQNPAVFSKREVILSLYFAGE